MTIEDRLDIMEQIGRYSYAEDGGDAAAYGALFTDDGVFEVYRGPEDEPQQRHEGRAAIEKWARGRYDERPEGLQTRHHQTGTVFDVLEGKRAVTRTELLVTRLYPDAVAPVPSVMGAYRDEWTKTPEGWRFARRTVRMD